MNSTILIAVISGGAGLALAAVSHAFNKRRDREAEWRKLKLDHYKEYVAALSGVVGERSTAESQARYSDAVNSMVLIAPPAVLRALYEFQDEIRVSNQTKSAQRHDETLAGLLREIRQDVHPKKPDDRGIVFRLMDAPSPVSQSGPAACHEGRANCKWSRRALTRGRARLICGVSLTRQ